MGNSKQKSHGSRSRLIPAPIGTFTSIVRRPTQTAPIIGFTSQGIPVVTAHIRRIGRFGEKFLGTTCPFCLREAGHGIGSGPRTADCGRGAYVLYWPGDGGRDCPPFSAVESAPVGR
jgi:hypothetical protein